MFSERAKNHTLCRVTAKKWYFVIVVMNINMLMDFCHRHTVVLHTLNERRWYFWYTAWNFLRWESSEIEEKKWKEAMPNTIHYWSCNFRLIYHFIRRECLWGEHDAHKTQSKLHTPAPGTNVKITFTKNCDSRDAKTITFNVVSIDYEQFTCYNWAQYVSERNHSIRVKHIGMELFMSIA